MKLRLAHYLAPLFMLLAAIFCGELSHAQPPAHVLLLSEIGGSCPVSVQITPNTPCPKVDVNLATGQAWVAGQGFVPLTNLLSITNASGGYVQNWDGSLTWKYGPVTNLVFPSQGGYNGAIWQRSNLTAADNTVVAPDGSLTGSTLTDTAGTSIHTLNTGTVAFTSGTTYIISAIVQAGTIGFSQLTLGGAPFAGLGYVNVNISTCTISGSGGTFVAAGAQALSGGWCRFWMAETATSSNSATGAVVMQSTGTATRSQAYTGTGTGTINVWGTQIEAIDYVTQTSPGPYVPTTTASASSVAQLRVGLGTGLLPEEPRQNLLVWSQDYSNAQWVSGSAGFGAFTVTNGAATAPDGTQTGQLVADNATTVSNYGVQSNAAFTINASTTYAFSAVLKQKDYQFATINLTTGATNHISYFDLSVCTVSGTPSGTVAQGAQWLSGGWCRIWITATSGGTETTAKAAIIYTNSNSASTHTGVVGTGTYFWGSQVEPGANMTSYFPNTSVAGTRAGDSISGLTASFLGNNPSVASIRIAAGLSSTASGQVFEGFNIGGVSIGMNATGSGRILWRNGTASRNDLGNTAVAPGVGQPLIMAVSADNATLAPASFNGQSGTNGTPPGQINWTSQVSIGSRNNGSSNSLYWNQYVQRITTWPIALNQAQLNAVASPTVAPTVMMDFANGVYQFNGYNVPLSGLIANVNSTGSTCTTGVGVVQTVAPNTNPVCQGTGLLPQDQRQNRVPSSQAFANGNWTTGSSGSVTDNQTAAPDGTNTASLYVESGATSAHVISSTAITASASTTYAISGYFKRRDYDWVQIVINDGFSQGYANVNLSTCALGNFGTGITAAWTQPAANGWCRLSGILTTNASSTQILWRAYGSRVGGNVSSAGPSYAGDGTSGFYVWGAQYEAAPFPTSYVATAGAAVTRNADVITAQAPLLALLGQSGAASMMANYVQSPYFASGAAPAGYRQYVADWTDTGNSRWNLRGGDAAPPVPSVVVGDGTTVSAIGSGPTSYAAGTSMNVAIRWSNTAADLAISTNSNTTATTARQFGGTLAAPFYIGGGGGTTTGSLGVPLAKLKIYPGGLSNAQLQAAQ